ncbi:MAG: hypothetical protein WD100_11770 [Tistlia sp.]|uniref:hypothetical protein n=1 Tax=Tistlia sp. TaxID=3057121 RepID=UPI0034A57DB5
MAASAAGNPAAAAEQKAASAATMPLKLQAVIMSGAKPIQRNVSFQLERFDKGRREMVANLTGGVADVKLQPGKYRLTTAYGATVIEEDIEIRSAKDLPHEVNLNAGEIGLRMIPRNGGQAVTTPIDWKVLSYRKNGKGERDVVFSANAAETEVVLPAGWYLVHANENGKLTKHTIEVGAGTRYVYTLVRK